MAINFVKTAKIIISGKVASIEITKFNDRLYIKMYDTDHTYGEADIEAADFVKAAHLIEDEEL